MTLVELQIDRLIGPTHHFGGLGIGNVASINSGGKISDPAAAALQGLDKMRLIASLGVPQLILPPQPRPDLGFLRQLGFTGNDRDILQRTFDEAAELLSAAASSSAVWTANAATVTPGIDSSQPRASVTIANLQASVHRSIEPPATEGELASLLENVSTLHAALPGGSAFSDEGAANHMRLAVPDNQPGINLFVYGDGELKPTIHRPRQRRAGSLAVARLHKLPADNTFFFQQHPAAIDAGAFHNDVVAMSHESLMIHHERAFLNADLQQLESRFAELTGVPLRRIEVSDSQLSLADAVATYLFNSQIVSPPGTDRPAIVCPAQVAKHPAASRVVQRWADDSLFDQPRFVDLDQSMDAGGGPACLRLRVPVTPDQLGSVRGGRWDERLDEKLREIIEREYPRSLTLAELAQADFCAHARKVTSTLRRVLLP